MEIEKKKKPTKKIKKKKDAQTQHFGRQLFGRENIYNPPNRHTLLVSDFVK
jgi:hypothetical protein